MGFQRRLQVLMLCAVAASALVWLRVAWLQVVQGEHWQEVARRASLRSVEQVARRGAIVDAEGRTLVHDMPVLELVLVPREWQKRERHRCGHCGSLHFRAADEGPPRRPRCCEAPSSPLQPLGAGSLLPLEKALGLEPGHLARRASVRQREIEAQVESLERRLKEEGLDEEDFLYVHRIARLRENRESQPVVLVPEVSLEVERLVGLDEQGVYRGLRLQPAHVRVAAEAGPLARVLGQASLPSEEDLARARAAVQALDLEVPLGRSGLERHHDALLRGTPGWELRARDEASTGGGQALAGEPARPGATLRLAASWETCQAAQGALEALPDLATGYAPRTRPSGALIAMRADTGAIVALAELPAWEPPGAASDRRPEGQGVEVLPLADLEVGDWVPARRLHLGPLAEPEQRRQVAASQGFRRLLLPWRVRERALVPWDPLPEGFDRERWRASLTAPGGEQLSRISQIAVEPGSTMKVFMALAMLESGLPLPIREPFRCDGMRSHPGCHNHPLVDLEGALETSCNQYFAYSLRDFASHWPTYRAFVAQFMRRLGFGQPTGSDLMGEASGLWLRREPWPQDEPVLIPRDSGRQVAIGQGEVTATPLQMVRAVAVLANGGRLVTPHLVEHAQRAGGPVEALPAPTIDLGLEPAHLARVREGMRRVVEGSMGTARHSYEWSRVPARVYGKTGTAQVARSWRPFQPGENVRGVSHQWFVGFAEAEGRPPIAFAVVYHARLEAGAGATAARTAGAFLEWWFRR